MTMYFLTCPTTGHDVRTTVEADGDLSSIQLDSNTMICPACGKPHTWSVMDGEVVVHDP